MKSRWFLVIVLVFIVTLPLTGCGISRSEYNAVADELDQEKQDKQELQTQLQEAQSRLSQAESDTIRAQVELEITQEQLDKAQSDLETAQNQLQDAQSQLTTINNDLQNAQQQIQSLKNELNDARDAPDEALGYAEFMDVLMYEVWMMAGITPNYTFSNAGEYHTALRNLADSIGDAQLINFVAEIEAGPIEKDRAYEMCYYCLSELEMILK
jgi:peptidoglycan hydrolase CwlO-like protein